MGFTKPVRVARFGGTSSTETANSAEPTSGKKDSGWDLNEAPASSFFNWLHYRAYKWFRWLDERAFDGATDDDWTLQGVDGGAGTDVDGGDLVLGGGQSTGSGSSVVTVQVATAGASGAAVRNPETYLEIDGSLELIRTQKPALVNSVSGSATSALRASSSTGTGHAIEATADVTSPVSSAVRVTPQDSDPSSNNNGDLYVNAVSGALCGYSSVRDPARYANLDQLIKSTTADSAAIANTGALTAFNQTASIPADTLRVGSVLRLNAFGEFVATASPNLSLEFRVDGVTYGLLPLTAVSTAGGWWLSCDVHIRTIGASGTSAIMQRLFGDTNKVSLGGGGSAAIDTTTATLIEVLADWNVASASNSVKMTGFTVEVI